ncbi:hypothetical protein SULPSESMR1_04710 (plasmid) [Pseudosulfitobacter pseudonitzschiae]|uniref:Uncharacterized protein n=1 Tax=Pseudosulfitobacter pseudonitzschiae TaxID=1402135 RepID=A0A221K5Y0_9RHOB|nr:hypothetical protein SULPSESMR1_04710 [Pseudosulfitobacter pseudonitzschiae]
MSYLPHRGCCHVNSPSLQVGMRIVDQWAFAADFHVSNASSRWLRMVRADRWRAGTEKKLRVADCIETKRCSPPGDRKPCIYRSRFREGRWLFSARLLSLCGTTDQVSVRPGVGGTIGSRFVPNDPFGHETQRFISLTKSRFAARLSRLDWRISSRGPNLKVQRRIVSYETSTPRSSISSSTSRRLKLKRP